MDNVIIKRLEACELAQFRAFCELAWKKPHPLIHNEQLFDYYYKRGNTLNFVCAKDSQTDAFLSVCGFIPASESENPDIWISFIVTKKGAPFGLGFQLLEYIKELTCCRTIACNNIRPNTRNLYEFFGYYVGELTQYYRINDAMEDCKLCHIVYPDRLPIQKSALSFQPILEEKELDCFDFSQFSENKPYKDRAYAAQRYFKNRWLNYQLFAARENGNTVAILVLRIIRAQGSCAVRVVDFIGDRERIADCGAFLDNLMRSVGAEFVDWYAFGIDDCVFAKAGFNKRNKDDRNIIPNYLEPPLMENVDFTFFTSERENYAMFKADGDQDRANLG